jgi:hypothetical protein
VLAASTKSPEYLRKRSRRDAQPLSRAHFRARASQQKVPLGIDAPQMAEHPGHLGELRAVRRPDPEAPARRRNRAPSAGGSRSCSRRPQPRRTVRCLCRMCRPHRAGAGLMPNASLVEALGLVVNEIPSRDLFENLAGLGLHFSRFIDTSLNLQCGHVQLRLARDQRTECPARTTGRAGISVVAHISAGRLVWRSCP